MPSIQCNTIELDVDLCSPCELNTGCPSLPYLVSHSANMRAFSCHDFKTCGENLNPYQLPMALANTGL